MQETRTRLYRGLAVEPSEVHAIQTAIMRDGLQWGGMTRKVMRRLESEVARTLLRGPTLEPNATRDDLGSAGWVHACGDREGASFYACRETGKAGLVVEFEVDIAALNVDGTDGLYTLAYLLPDPEVASAIEMAFGPVCLSHLLNWLEDRRGLATAVDLVCHLPEVVRAHLSSNVVIFGKAHARFKSAFMFPQKVGNCRIISVKPIAETGTHDDEHVKDIIVVTHLYDRVRSSTGF